MNSNAVDSQPSTSGHKPNPTRDGSSGNHSERRRGPQSPHRVSDDEREAEGEGEDENANEQAVDSDTEVSLKTSHRRTNSNASASIETNSKKCGGSQKKVQDCDVVSDHSHDESDGTATEDNTGDEEYSAPSLRSRVPLPMSAADKSVVSMNLQPSGIYTLVFGMP